MKIKRILHCSIAALCVAGPLQLAAGEPAAARPSWYSDRYDEASGRSTPLLAVVGLKEQRVTIYDAKGKMMESPVSSGQTGLETPAGIYSIVQKEEDHRSNIYDDASMPFMERLTWTGIALHAGVLPGHPASHGCVRMPEDFAERLYGITHLGMRVIVVREDIAPVEVAQPAMFTRASAAKDESLPGANAIDRLKAAANSKFQEAEAAVRRYREARVAASKKAAEAAVAGHALHAAESSLAGAEAEVKAAERAAGVPGPAQLSAQAESGKAQALAKAGAAQAKVEAAKNEMKLKAEAAARAEEQAQAAAAATALAHDASEEAEQNLWPVSVFISRKAQRLYIRKNNLPVYEGPVTMRDADKPIGTFVFTALDSTGGSGAMRWNAVSMYKNATDPGPLVRVAQGQNKARHTEAAPADVAAAQAALARIAVPQEAQNRISAVVLPGSSLIVSDEAASIETGKDTDFVVVMSGEPQGGLSIRHHETSRRDRGDYDGWFFSRSRRSGGGGFPFFFPD